MINLLPPEEKLKILGQRREKLAIIVWFLVLFFIVCLGLVLLSIKFYSQGLADSEKIILSESEKRLEKSRMADLEKNIQSANEDMKNIGEFYQNKILFSDILDKISGSIPQGSYLTTINLSSSSDKDPNIITVSFGGFSPNRENLFSLKTNLEKTKEFKEIYFPPTNWSKPTDISFTASFKTQK